MPLWRLEDRWRGRALLLGYGWFLLVYLGAPALAWRAPTPLSSTALDRAVPIVPASIWIYHSLAPMLVLTIFGTPGVLRRSRAFAALALTIGMAGLVFLIFPTTLPRPPIPEGVHSAAWRWLHELDPPVNCLPSLHASQAVIAAWALSGRGRPWMLGAWAWAAGILASTLTTGQHVVIDLVAGLALALVASLLARWLYPEERAPDTESNS